MIRDYVEESRQVERPGGSVEWESEGSVDSSRFSPSNLEVGLLVEYRQVERPGGIANIFRSRILLQDGNSSRFDLFIFIADHIVVDTVCQFTTIVGAIPFITPVIGGFKDL